MSQPDPRRHHEFSSNRKMMALRVPLVIDEHEMTGVTISTLKTELSTVPMATVQISTSGPVVMKEAGSDEELNNIKKSITVPGNDSFHIQSPREYDYPSGKEGELCVQANLLIRKYEAVNGQEVPCDSLSIDMYIRRKLINAFKAVWTSAEGALVNIGGSVLITALVALITPFFGQDVGSLIPHLAVVFVFLALVISVINSYRTRDKLIKERLKTNVNWQDLVGGNDG